MPKGVLYIKKTPTTTNKGSNYTRYFYSQTAVQASQRRTASKTLRSPTKTMKKGDSSGVISKKSLSSTQPLTNRKPSRLVQLGAGLNKAPAMRASAKAFTKGEASTDNPILKKLLEMLLKKQDNERLESMLKERQEIHDRQLRREE